MAFTHLHVRTCYSFLSGVPTPEELFESAKAKGFDAIAVTDRANQAGCIDVADAAKKFGVKAILGTELWTAPVVEIHQPEGKKKPVQAIIEPGHRLVLLATSLRGWKNVTRLTTLAHRRMFYVPRLSLDELREFKDDVICLSGTPSGAVGQMGDLAEREIEALKSIFDKENLFLEVVDHGLDAQAEANARTRRLAETFDLRVVATNEVVYLEPEDVSTLDAMTCVAMGRSMFGHGNPRESTTDQAYLKEESEMESIFSREELDVSMEIASRCEIALERKKVFLPTTKPPEDKPTRESQWKWLLEWLPPPKAFVDVSREMPDREDVPIDELYFDWYASAGLEVRFSEDPERFKDDLTRQEYRDRLAWEVVQIRKMGFPTYLMIVAEFVNWAKDQEIPTGPGRGSAAGSLAVWCLRITDIDPIRFNLLFERFLNPSRVSMPDIDCDFSQDRREEVIEHVKERYGNDYVGQIAAIQTFQPKKAVRDAARLCGVAFDAQDLLSKPFDESSEDGKKLDSIEKGIKNSDRLRNMYDNDPLSRTVLEIAKRLEGRPRHTTVHAAGTVIASRRLDEIVGLFTDQETGRSVIGIDMVGAEDLGLVKFDFLGLKTLDVIAYAVELVRRRTGKSVDLTKIPLDDPKVLDALGRADTKGVFQVESDGMNRLIQGLKPSSIEDLIAALALYRPGPLQSGMVQDFVDRKHGKKEVVHMHEKLASVLGKTYGVIVYQEQVMQIAQVLSGYSLAEADLLRRAMGKKKPEEMAKQKKSFVEGAVKNGVTEEKAKEIFDLVDFFSGYGFNRCLTGETRVYRAGANSHSGPDVTIKEIYDAQASKTPWGKKIRAGRLNILSFSRDGQLRPKPIKKVYENGVQDVVKVTTEGGHSIRATPRHRLLTDKGYRQVSRLKVGDRLVVSDFVSRSWKAQDVHREKTVRAKDHLSGCGSSYEGKGFPREAENPAWIDGRTELVRGGKKKATFRAAGKCEACSGELGKKPEVAHIKTLDQCNGELKVYHDAENLKLMCNSCHKKLDYKKGERKKRWTKGVPTKTDVIRSIKPDGREMTYDIEMNDEEHNFLANHIVSHNSHSAAYGIISWQTAWLKTYHRAEFMAAAMSWEKSGSAEVAAMVIDVLSAGIKLAGPDIDESTVRFDVVTRNGEPMVRFGIGSLKGIGVAAQQKILDERTANGPYGTMDQFLARRDPRVINKKICESLSEAGAFDRFGVPRWFVHEALKKKIGHGRKSKKKPVVVEAPRTLEELVVFRKKYRMEPPWPFSEKLRLEQRILGFWVTGHPLDRYEEMSLILPSATSRTLKTIRWGEPVTLACVPLEILRKRGREKRTITFATFSDRHGVFEAIAFHEVSERFKAELDLKEPVLVRGTFERGTVRIEEVTLLSELRRKMARLVQINVKKEKSDPENLTKMLQVLEKHPGNVSVRLKATKADRRSAGMVMTDVRVDPSENLFLDLELWADDHLVGQILPKTAR